MLDNPVSQALVSKQLQLQAQSFLEQARLQKTAQRLEMALASYDQAKVTFRHAANARQLVPLSGVKSALNQARTPQTAEEDALRQRISEVYFERAELLEKLGNPDKAKASYQKAQAWSYGGIAPAPTATAVSSSALTSLKAPVMEEFNGLADSMLKAFSQTKVKDLSLWREVLPLASSQDPAKCRYLLEEIDKILTKQERELVLPGLQSLAILIHNLPKSLFKRTSGNIVKVLKSLINYLKFEYLEYESSKGNIERLQLLLQATSQILDELAKAAITGILYAHVQEPLDKLLSKLCEITELEFQAYYARQALAHIPRDDSRWEERWKQGANIILGAPTLVSAINTLDLCEILEIFDHFSEIFSGTEGTANRLAELSIVMEDFDSSKPENRVVTPRRLIKTRQQQWYAALQFLDICLEEGQFEKFEQFACHSIYTHNVAFLLGLSQRLEQIASMYPDMETQKGAKQLLENLLQDKVQWGGHERVIEMAQIALKRLEQPVPIGQGYIPTWASFWQEPPGTQLLPINKDDLAIHKPLSLQRAQDAIKALSSDIRPAFLEKQASPAHALRSQSTLSEAQAATQLKPGQSVPGPKLSIPKLPSLPESDVPRAQSAQLLELLKDQSNALIEIIGPLGVGKTTLIKSLIHPHPDSFFVSYDLIAWIDCSSTSRAHADIQAISHTLGYGNLNPQAALRQFANYVQQHPRSLLILDGVAASDIESISSWLKPFFSMGQLIYTTTQSLSDKLSESLERPVQSFSLSPFNADQAKHLVQQCLPKESFKDGDFAQVIQMTGGYPGVIKALCRHYQSMSVMFKDFADFLAQPHKHQGKRDVLLSEIAKASLEPLEEQALTHPVAVRALTLLKQAAWLGDHSIPFAFFVDKHQQVDLIAIQMLYDKQLALLEIDHTAGSLKINSAFMSAVQKQFESEQHLLLEKNIQRLSEVFSYLTNNEGKKGLKSQPADLKPYADLVDTLLFETCVKLSSSEKKASLLSQTLSLSENKLTLLSQVLALGSSLARLYYLYHGELQLAYERLDKAQDFFKLGAYEELIAHFEQSPENFTPYSISSEEAQLLKLYSQEYLYQIASLAFQLSRRGQVPVTVIQNFEKSYAIQVNLGKHVDPEAIAYTLCNFARAVRKQGLLVSALEIYGKLEQWMEQYPKVFDESTRARLLVDQGIIQKEVEDAKPQAERNYTAAIKMLLETHDVYLRNEAGNQRWDLGMLSIYLGETYLADGKFELGIQHTCQILYYDGGRQQNQARAYFNLARAFDGAECGALAKLFIDQAAPLQIKAYESTTEALRLKIEAKLLERYQQTESFVPITKWETQTDLAEHCKKFLVNSSAPSQHLSHQQIQELEDQAYNWLWQHDAKISPEAKRIEIAKTIAKLDTAKKEEAERLALQREQDELWYQYFAQRAKLDNPSARSFAKQFKEKLWYEIVQQLRLANGEPMLMGKTDLVDGLSQAVSGVLLQTQLGTAAGDVATINLLTIIQGVTQILSEHKQQKAEAQHTTDALEEPERQSKSSQIYKRIKQEIDEMAEYAARCWQPVFSGQTWSNQDIQTLAEYGARRVMDYLKTGGAGILSPKEQVVIALMTGEANARLMQPKVGEQGQLLGGKWSVQGFFAKPGIKVEEINGEQAVYLPDRQARPDTYGYRFGSPVEARTCLYQGPFKSEAEAQQCAEAARHEQSRCTVM